MVRSVPGHQRDHVLLKTPAFGETERLGSQERVTVAERLLQDASVSKVYVNDIVRCVADMVCEMETDHRFSFAEKIFTFISSGQHFEGRETFCVFGDTLLPCLNEDERKKIAEMFLTGMAPNHVLSCEAHMWGLVMTIPTLTPVEQKSFTRHLLTLSVHVSLRDMVLDGVSRVIFTIPHHERLEMTFFIAENLKQSVNRDYERFILQILSNVTSSLPDNDRILIADAVVPMVFDADVHVVRKALGFFMRNLSTLPIKSRYPYALMITELIKDAALTQDAKEALQQILPALGSAQERTQIKSIIDAPHFQQSDEIEISMSDTSPSDPVMEHIYLDKE